MKTVLIAGGAGYIGSHANKMLSRRGYNTIVYDSLATGHREAVKWGKLIEGDILDSDKLRTVFKENQIDAVMHFAAFSLVGESVTDPAKYYHNNVSGTLSLLNAMREAGCGYFIFSSTCATYGMPVENPMSESHPQNPINPYGNTKLAVERMLADFSDAYGLKYSALRYFNAAGADSDAETGENHNPESHLIPLVLDAAMGRRENIKIFGTDYNTPDGTCIRDYIHVNDLSDAHILALEYLMNGGASTAFNLGNGNGYSVRQIIASAEKAVGHKIPTVETDRRPGDPDALVGSAQKAKSLLGWKPQLADIDTIIETAYKWHRTLHGGK